MNSIADEYPDIQAAVDNIPINLNSTTPFDVVKKFDWITLDLRWAGMYKEFDKFEEVKSKLGWKRIGQTLIISVLGRHILRGRSNT